MWRDPQNFFLYFFNFKNVILAPIKYNPFSLLDGNALMQGLFTTSYYS